MYCWEKLTRSTDYLNMFIKKKVNELNKIKMKGKEEKNNVYHWK